MKKAIRLKQKSGVALIYVVLALLFLSFMITTAVLVSRANLRQTSAQEKSIQAFYIARSGVEVAYEALLTTDLLDNFKSDTSNTYTLGPTTVNFPNEGVAIGTAIVNVTSSGTGDTKKILIQSTGQMASGGITRTVSLEFYARYDLYPDIKWSD